MSQISYKMRLSRHMGHTEGPTRHSHTPVARTDSHRAPQDIPGPIADLPMVLPLETNRPPHILSWSLEMLPGLALYTTAGPSHPHLHSLKSLTIPLFSHTCSSPKFLIIISSFLVRSKLAFFPFWLVLLFLLSGLVPGEACPCPASPTAQPTPARDLSRVTVTIYNEQECVFFQCLC